MSELEEKLEHILGNPQAMAQIMSLAQSLNQSGPAAGSGDSPQAQPEAAAPPPSPAAPAPPPSPAPAGDGGGLEGLLGGLDLNMLSAAGRLLGGINSGDDDRRVALLTALRPFVREQRYARLDKAIQIARLSRLIRSGLDLFRAGQGGSRGEEDGHV